MIMPLDTKAKEHMEECSMLIKLLQEKGESYTDEFRARCRKQLRDVIGKLWAHHSNHMTHKDARNAIWVVLSNGIAALRVE